MAIRSRRWAVLLGVLLACSPRNDAPPARLPLGTWGGDGAGVIVGNDEAHVHIGCTKGEIAGAIALDEDGGFDVSGRHNVDAYPVDRGIYHPSRYRGRATAREMTLTVELTDTAQRLGPVTVFLGQEPRIGPCPICRR